MKKKPKIFFFSCHFSSSVTILGWSNAYDVMGILLGTVWIKSFSLAWIHLHCSSNWSDRGDLWKEGRKAWKNEEIYGNGGGNGIAKGKSCIVCQDVGINCCMPKEHCKSATAAQAPFSNAGLHLVSPWNHMVQADCLIISVCHCFAKISCTICTILRA